MHILKSQVELRRPGQNTAAGSFIGEDAGNGFAKFITKAFPVLFMSQFHEQLYAFRIEIIRQQTAVFFIAYPHFRTGDIYFPVSAVQPAFQPEMRIECFSAKVREFGFTEKLYII